MQVAQAFAAVVVVEAFAVASFRFELKLGRLLDLNFKVPFVELWVGLVLTSGEEQLTVSCLQGFESWFAFAAKSVFLKLAELLAQGRCLAVSWRL